VSKEGGSFDALTGSTISSRAYANAVETAYAGYLWAKGELPSAEDAMSGATKPNEEQTTNVEPEAQKGEQSNE
jgi:electron transport complex protein RnfG